MSRVLTIVFAILLLAAPLRSEAADGVAVRVHRLVIHVDDNDPAKMNLALNNALNVSKFYGAKGEDYEVKVVAYGPGLTMLRADTSPVADRIRAFIDGVPGISFAACGNTIEGMKKAEGKDIPIIDKVPVVPSGVVTLMSLQEEGWSYLRP